MNMGYGIMESQERINLNSIDRNYLNTQENQNEESYDDNDFFTQPNNQFKFNEPKNIDANIATDKLVEDNQILKKSKDFSQDYNIVKKD